ncbi:c-type cytochrome [Aquirufa echingensis]|uniref:Cytochrome c n=1 Tax=Aquirufa echingensis TaxID=3096516 RepID=A0ABW6D2X1_9BACT
MKHILFISLVALFASCQSKEEIMYQQYVVEGRSIYEKNCANCHQSDGSGLRDLYPALAKTDLWKRVNAQQLVCIIKQGQKGEIKVNGKSYSGYMPANTKLEAIDMAELVTFMKDSWGDKKIYSFDEARAALKNCP